MSIATDPTTEQLIAELYKIDGKAEIVDGRIVMMSPTGEMPSSAGGRIFAEVFRQYARQHGGCAYPDNVAFLVDLPNRKSFCPDAAYYTGPRTGMKFLAERRILPPKCAAKAITGRAPNERWRQSGPIISRPARRSFGMSIC